MSTPGPTPLPAPLEPARALPGTAAARQPAARDPWVIGGLVLLAALSWAVVALYRSGPQSAGAVRDRVWLAAQPDAFSPRIAEAERLLRQAGAEPQAGQVQETVVLLAAAAAEADQARTAADTPERRAQANELWGEAMLRRAAVMVELGSAPWWRGDDDQVLTGARTLVERVLGSTPSAALRARAEALRAEILRKLRPGPLEWLPSPR